MMFKMLPFQLWRVLEWWESVLVLENPDRKGKHSLSYFYRSPLTPSYLLFLHRPTIKGGYL
jgi:hypothetical protein